MAGRVECRFAVGIATTQGCRDYQEDSFAITDPLGSSKPFSELEQLVVALGDGVGGEVGGDLASSTVVSAFCSSVQQGYDSKQTEELLNDALAQAGDAIAVAIAEDPDFRGMATTLVGALVSLESLVWVSVGDSHLYRLRDGSIEKLNADHSLGAFLDEQALRGIIDPEEAQSTPGRNMLRSVVDGQEVELVDLQAEALDLNVGDRLLLASDGINTLPVDKIASISESHTDTQKFADALISAVEAVGNRSQDNTLVIVINLTLPEESAVTVKIEPVDHKQKRQWPLLLLLPIIAMAAFFGVKQFAVQQSAPELPLAWPQQKLPDKQRIQVQRPGKQATTLPAQQNPQALPPASADKPDHGQETAMPVTLEQQPGVLQESVNTVAKAPNKSPNNNPSALQKPGQPTINVEQKPASNEQMQTTLAAGAGSQDEVQGSHPQKSVETVKEGAVVVGEIVPMPPTDESTLMDGVLRQEIQPPQKKTSSQPVKVESEKPLLDKAVQPQLQQEQHQHQP